MPDGKSIEDIMSVLGVNPTEGDHQENEAAHDTEAKPEKAFADITQRFAESMAAMSDNQKTIMEGMLKKMEEINAPKAEVAAKPDPVETVYVPNPALAGLKTTDPDLFEILSANDKADFDRNQQMLSVISGLTEKIDMLGQASDNNLNYLEENVVSAKHADASVITKTPEFTAWVDSQNPIVRAAYTDVLKSGTPSGRINLIDLYKEHVSAGKDEQAKKAVAPPADTAAKISAPMTLTDFQSVKPEGTDLSLAELMSDETKMAKYYATAGGDRDKVLELWNNLNEQAAKAGIL